jgi:hypothetical protein
MYLYSQSFFFFICLFLFSFLGNTVFVFIKSMVIQKKIYDDL